MGRGYRGHYLFLVVGVLACCVAACGKQKSSETSMNAIAASYVKLVLAVGEHDAGYVDAYYGPETWQEQVRAAGMSLDDIRGAANGLLDEIGQVNVGRGDAMLELRQQYLTRQLEALLAYVEKLSGAEMSFDEESQALFDAVAPTHPASYFQGVLAELDAALPGEGSVADRYNAFHEAFYIPKDKVDAVFKAAIAECRRRTLEHIDLPENERFEIEYVTGKPWSAYNWYQGDNHSLIQVNTDFPISVSRAIDLACHEGYPGHHVYNVLLESRLVDGRGWVEYCVYPLFSPQSLIAEGSANFGIRVAFPNNERVKFERDVLFPLAGLDPEQAARFYEIEALKDRLGYAGNEAARGYLDGDTSREEAMQWLMDYALSTRARAEQRLDFFDTYGSYVINYNLGQDLVRQYVEQQVGESDDPTRRWDEFTAVISSPRLPSGLR